MVVVVKMRWWPRKTRVDASIGGGVVVKRGGGAKNTCKMCQDWWW